MKTKLLNFIQYMIALQMNDHRNFYTYGSVDRMRLEQETHRMFYPTRIHPRSRFRIFWETFFIGYSSLSMIYYFAVVTITRYTTNKELISYALSHLAAEIPFVANIVFNFITGFHRENRAEAVMDFLPILKHYVKTTMFFDIFGLILGSPLLNNMYGYEDENDWYNLGLLMVRSCGILSRMASPWYYMRSSIKTFFMIGSLMHGIIEFFVFFPVIFSFLLTFYVVYCYDTAHEPHPHNNLLHATKQYMYLAMKIWMKTNTNHLSSHAPGVIIDVMVVLYAYARYCFLISLLIALFLSRYHIFRTYCVLEDNLNEYMTLVNISGRLKIRIVKFYQETYRDKFHDQVNLMAGISSEIKDDLVLMKLAKLREEIAVFKFIPNEEMILICTRLVKEVFFGNDTIAYSGTTQDRMYFIAKGTVAFYTDNATEIFHVPEANHFLWTGIDADGKPLVANYLACETTVLYSLTRQDYNIIKSQCPIFVELITFKSDFLMELILFMIQKDKGE